MFRIKKFLQSILFVVVANQNVCFSASNSLLNCLNSIIPTQSPVYIITVTRSLGNVASGGIREGYLRLNQQRFDNLKQTLEDLCSGAKPNSMPRDSLKIVVFNECFFQKNEPLEKGDVSTFGTKDYFLDELKQLSRRCPNTIFYPNFLYKEALPRLLTQRQQNIVNTKIQNFHLDQKFISEYDKKFFTAQAPNPTSIFRNVTYGILNGQKMTKYKKRSYCSEWNFGVQKNSIYDFGDGVDHIAFKMSTPPNFSKEFAAISIANRMIQNISTEICFDLWHGVRQQNHWDNSPRLLLEPFNFPKPALHLIQSNWINPVESLVNNDTRSHDNIKNLPTDTLIVHADPSDPSPAGSGVFRVDASQQRFTCFVPSYQMLLNSNISDKIKVRVWKS